MHLLRRKLIKYVIVMLAIYTVFHYMAHIQIEGHCRFCLGKFFYQNYFTMFHKLITEMQQRSFRNHSTVIAPVPEQRTRAMVIGTRVSFPQ